jgi:hypothetical protein
MGVLTWQNRITRAVVRQRDLFGRWPNRWTVIRTSNAYVFSDPKLAENRQFRATSENPTGTQNQDISRYLRPVLRELLRERSEARSDGAAQSQPRIRPAAGRRHGWQPRPPR